MIIHPDPGRHSPTDAFPMLALRPGSYDVKHRDPFERRLAAESELESRVLVTHDTSFEESAFAATWCSARPPQPRHARAGAYQVPLAGDPMSHYMTCLPGLRGPSALRREQPVAGVEVSWTTEGETALGKSPSQSAHSVTADSGRRRQLQLSARAHQERTPCGDLPPRN